MLGSLPLTQKQLMTMEEAQRPLETREQCSPPVDYCDIVGLDAHRPQSRRKAVNYRTVTTRNWLTEAHGNDYSISQVQVMIIPLRAAGIIILLHAPSSIIMWMALAQQKRTMVPSLT